MTHKARYRIFVGKDVHKFSCAHMTVFPDGTKERIHGHNYQVEVALELGSIAFGHIVDFGIVKDAIQSQCGAWNERLLLAERNPFYQPLSQNQTELEFKLCGKRYVIPADEVLILAVDNIVVETLSAAFAEQLVARLGGHLRSDVVTGIEVTVSESPRQGAVTRITDLR